MADDPTTRHLLAASLPAAVESLRRYADGSPEA
jgi:hypothetical protein